MLRCIGKFPIPRSRSRKYLANFFFFLDVTKWSLSCTELSRNILRFVLFWEHFSFSFVPKKISLYLRDILRYGELSKKQKIQLFLHHSYSARCCINISIELGICTENFVVPRNNELITIMEWMRSTN